MQLFPNKAGLGVWSASRGAAAVLIASQMGAVTAGTVVQFRTSVGNLDVELYDVEKPATTENFLRNVTEGLYGGAFFDELKLGSYLAGGSFNPQSNAGSPPTNRPAIANEFNSGPVLPNVAGTLSMMTDRVNTNQTTLRFFFNLKDNPQFDSPTNNGGAVVFGRVIGSKQVLDTMNAFKPAIPLPTEQFFQQTNCIVTVPPSLLNTPVLGFTKKADSVYEAKVVSLDISLLRVRVSQDADGFTRVRWNPVYGRTNTVEYTDVFPPVWQKLADVPPASIPTPVYSAPGAALNLPAVVVDENAAPGRFYRVRATY